MSSPLDYLELCRLCLVKDRVQVPIFEDDGDVNQIFLKIHACLPVKVSRDDKLPRKICSDCSYKLELFYQFWNTTANAEKQLLQWLGEDDGLDDKQQGYVTEVLDPNVMKQEGNSDSRLDNSVMQVSGHQNMDINMIENMSIITMPAGSDQQFTTVPMGTRGTVQTVQVPGPSTQTAHDQTGVAHLQEVEVDQEDEDNMDDGCDNDDGLPVKEETDEGDRSLEQSYVSLPCDEAGPSGLQQQKISEMSEITIQQTADGDHKTGYKSGWPRSRSRGTRRAAPSAKPSVSTRPQRTRARAAAAAAAAVAAAARAKTAPKKAQQPADGRPIRARAWPAGGSGGSGGSGGGLDDEREGRYSCARCADSFGSLASLQEHSKTHAFGCEHCQLTFRLRSQLKRHAAEAHSALPRFVCGECQSVFKCRQSLREHLVRKHTEGFRFACAGCGKKFKMKSDLYMHVQSIHGSAAEGEQAICDVCGKAYRNAFALKKHLAHAHNQRPFACEVCKRRLATERSLEQHALLHLRKERAVCQVCGKTFSGNDALKKHMRIHTGQRPFACKLCGKTFRRQNTHKQHLLTHSGVKPYVCDVCGKAFTQKPGLITHRKKHPGPLPPLPSVSIDYVIADLVGRPAPASAHSEKLVEKT